MRANSRYVEIARESLRDNQPKLHDQLKAAGQLETFLEQRAQAALDQAVDVHLRNFRAGVPAGTSVAEAQNQAIRDHLLFPSQEEQNSPDGYYDPDSSTEASKWPSPGPDFEPGEFEALSKSIGEAFVKNLNDNVRCQQKKK